MATIGGRDVEQNDLGVMAAGAAALVFSFLPFWGFSYSAKTLGGLSASISAWHGAVLLGLLMIIAAAGLVAARVFGDVALPTLPVGWHVIVAALGGLGSLIVILRGLTYPHASLPGGSYGMKWGGYLLFLAGVVETVFAVMALRASGESLSFDRGAPDTPPATT